MRASPRLAIVLVLVLSTVSLASPLASPLSGDEVEGWLVLEKRQGEPVHAYEIPAQPQHSGGDHDPLDAYAAGTEHCGLQIAPADTKCYSGPDNGWYQQGGERYHILYVPICPRGCFAGTLSSHIAFDGTTRTFSCDIVWASLASEAAFIATGDGDDPSDLEGPGYHWSCHTTGEFPDGLAFRHTCDAEAHPTHDLAAGFWDCGVGFS